AQIVLPPIQLPDATRTLPPLPDIRAEPLISVVDRLAQDRLDRIAALLHDRRESIELDERGEPAVRGVLVASGIDAAMIARAANAGFTLLDSDRIEGL